MMVVKSAQRYYRYGMFSIVLTVAFSVLPLCSSIPKSKLHPYNEAM